MDEPRAAVLHIPADLLAELLALPDGVTIRRVQPAAGYYDPGIEVVVEGGNLPTVVPGGILQLIVPGIRKTAMLDWSSVEAG